jgi:hypothetical protein
MARLATNLVVGALLRQVHAAGGSAMVLARGEAEAGGILVLLLDRGANPRFVESGIGPDGMSGLIPAGPRDFPEESAIAAYWQRRRERDPDLWVVELDVAGAERFAAETFRMR